MRNRQRKRRGDRLAEYRSSVRVACFTMDDPSADSSQEHGEWMHGYANMSLWAHYGNGNRGACLVFDGAALEKAAQQRFRPESLHIEDVEYVAGEDESYERTRVIADHLPEDQDIPLARTSLFRKSHHWSGEAERRILVEAWQQGLCSVPIKECLVGLVVGVKFPSHHLGIVKAVYHDLGLHIDYVAQLYLGSAGAVATVPMVAANGEGVQMFDHAAALSPHDWHSSLATRGVVDERGGGGSAGYPPRQ